MRRIDLFFNNILSCIEGLISELNIYYEANNASIEGNDVKSTKFADFDTELNTLRDSVIESLATRFELIENFLLLDEFNLNYNNFINAFEDFTSNNTLFIQYWIIIAKRLNEVKEADLDLNVTLNIDHFKIIDLEDTIIENNFINYNIDLGKCLIIYTLNSDLNNFLANKIHSAHVDLLLIWLNALDASNSVEGKQFVLIYLENPPILKDLKSILKIQVLINGNLIKSLEKYEFPPNQPFLNQLDYTQKYVQFDSISNILNEYNNQKYLLDKFLKLYHIIENFMYKQKICKLQRERTGNPLQIRDFQTLYDRFSSNENSSIQEFFKNVFSLNYNGNTFLHLIIGEWINLETINVNMPNEIDSLFSQLALKNSYKYNNLKTTLNGEMFAVIVYKIRNSIVHNKDTEMHFESTNLPIGAKFILEKFFIPNLEKIIYHLVINPNQIVWYDDDKLLLYHL